MISICWLLIFLVLLVFEIISLGLTTIWFAAGALVAFAASMLGADLIIQVILFIVVSILLLLLTRPIAVKYLNCNKTKTNVDELVGKKVEVVSRVDNMKETGEAKVNGEIWSARSEGEVIEAGEYAEIVSIQGVKLILKKI